MYHLMLCDEFDAQRALQIGLVQEVVPYGRHIERGMELTHAIAKNAPLGLRAMKQDCAALHRGGRGCGDRGDSCGPRARAEQRGREGRHPLFRRASRCAPHRPLIWLSSRWPATKCAAPVRAPWREDRT
jgi:1,4-dihydroxy-2-naphthoyl-CoA synthase